MIRREREQHVAELMSVWSSLQSNEKTKHLALRCLEAAKFLEAEQAAVDRFFQPQITEED